MDFHSWYRRVSHPGISRLSYHNLHYWNPSEESLEMDQIAKDGVEKGFTLCDQNVAIHKIKATATRSRASLPQGVVSSKSMSCVVLSLHKYYNYKVY